ncbi:MAG: CdaR family protein [Candidatus Binatia bacterium]
MTARERLRRLRPRDVGGSLRWLVLHNAGMKALSLVAAIALWFFVNAGERDAEQAMQLPVELHNRPASLMLVSPRVEFVDLVVSGPRTLLNRIDTEQLAVVLDLRRVRPGPAVFRIVGEALDLPRGVEIVQLTPSEVTLEFAAVVRKTLPVRVGLSGKPEGDLRVTDTQVAPETVEVIGPADLVDQMKVAETVPIDLSKAVAGVIERDLVLEPPREYISYSGKALVHVTVVLEEPEGTRVISGLPVVVRNSEYRTTLKPAAVQIVARGPRSVIESLELGHGAVYIDAAGREPGTYETTPDVDLPPDVEVVKQEPASVTLRVLRQKRNGDGR